MKPEWNTSVRVWNRLLRWYWQLCIRTKALWIFMSTFNHTNGNGNYIQRIAYQNLSILYLPSYSQDLYNHTVSFDATCLCLPSLQGHVPFLQRTNASIYMGCRYSVMNVRTNLSIHYNSLNNSRSEVYRVKSKTLFQSYSFMTSMLHEWQLLVSASLPQLFTQCGKTTWHSSLFAAAESIPWCIWGLTWITLGTPIQRNKSLFCNLMIIFFLSDMAFEKFEIDY